MHINIQHNVNITLFVGLKPTIKCSTNQGCSTKLFSTCMRATPELQQQQVKNEDATTEGKAAALLHGQILDAADDRGIYYYLIEKLNISLLWKKKMKFSCSEQKANTAAKKRYQQARRTSGFQAT